MKNNCPNYELFETKTRDRAQAVACMLDNIMGDVHRPTEMQAFSRLNRRRNGEENYNILSNDPNERHGVTKDYVAGKEKYIFERDVENVMKLLEDDGSYFYNVQFVNPEGRTLHGKTLYNNGKIVEAMQTQGYAWVNKYHVRTARTRLILKNKRSRP